MRKRTLPPAKLQRQMVRKDCCKRKTTPVLFKKSAFSFRHYLLLYDDTEKRAVEEMKHAEILTERILYLEGIPIITKLDKINVGSAVKEQVDNDYGLEKVAIQRLQRAIKLCIDEADGGSRELLEHILVDEERHANDLEAYLQQIKDMGIQNFLVTQVHKKEKS